MVRLPAAEDAPHLRDVPAQRSTVAALLVAPDGRYLMQQRDDRPELGLPGHWVLFGGRIEAGETPAAALRRELREELDFACGPLEWLTESRFTLPQRGLVHEHKVYFACAVTLDQIAAMTLREGAGMALWSLESLLAQLRIHPWDVSALILHGRLDRLFPGMLDIDRDVFTPR